MKILVCIKQVPHQDARLESAGAWIKEDGIKFEINSYDTFALEEALRIKDAGEAEVIVAAVGPARTSQALRTALGMGADRAVHVNDDACNGSDALGVAKILAAIAKEEAPDLVFMGLMSDDGNQSAVPPMAAELLGVPSATAVMKAALADGCVRCERELEGGALEVVELPLPAVLAVQSGMNQVRYASLKGIMAAKKKPIAVKSAAELGVAEAVGEGAAKARITKVYAPPKGDSAEMVSGGTDEITAALVAKIKELGLL